MDGLNAAASIIAVLQISSSIVKYINTATGATKERKRLLDAVQACESILQQLKDEADDSEEGKAWLETIKALKAPDAPLSRLWAILSIIKTKLEPVRCQIAIQRRAAGRLGLTSGRAPAGMERIQGGALRVTGGLVARFSDIEKGPPRRLERKGQRSVVLQYDFLESLVDA